MKKSLILLAAAALAFVGCQKEVASRVQEQDEAVTFSVALNEGTKATVYNDGMGAKVDTIKVAVYMHTNNAAQPYKFYDAPEATYDAATKTGTFTVNLIKSQTYQVVVWADKDGRYTCDKGLQEIVRDTDHVCNNDEYDAFFASVPFTQGVTTSTTITAKRPFAQLNFITTDIKAGFEPSTVSVKYTAPSQFNALTDKVSDSAVFTHVADVYKKDPTADKKNTLVMDYILVDGTESAVLSEVTMTAKVVDTQTNVYNNIPLTRNYRTNVIGALLTTPEDFQVVVDPTWFTPETDVLWKPVASVAEAIEALKNGDATNVTIEKVEEPASGQDATVLSIPETTKPLGIALPADNTVPVKIVYETTSTTGQTPSLNVTADNTDKVEIIAPQSHVTLNGTLYEAIVAETSSTTLVIEQGVTVKDLTVNKGGLEIHGTVNALTIPKGADVVVRACEGLSDEVYAVLNDYIDSDYTAVKVDGKWNILVMNVAMINGVKYHTLQDAIKAALEANDGVPVELICDIEYAEGSDWTPIVFNGGTVAIDGKGYTVKGLPGMLFNKQNSGGHHLIMKNITFDGAKVNGTTGNEAVIVGYADAMNELYFENVVIKNSTVTGSNYAAAFVGYAAGYNVLSNGPVFQEVTFKNCVVEKCTITGGGSTGALMGHATGNAWGNVTVTGTTVKNNIVTSTGSATNKAGSVFGTVGAAGDPNANPAVPEGKVAGLFVSADVSGNTVTSNGTTITTICGRQGSTGGRLFMTAGGSYDAAPYNAADTWASCVDGYGLVENDGVWSVEVLPIVAKIGTKEYLTLQAAIEDATADDVIELFEGTYTTYGTVYAKGKTLTFEGVEGKTIWHYGKDSSVGGEGGSDYSFEDSNVTFKNITLVDNYTVNSYYRGFVRPLGLTFENCTIKNMMGYLGVGDVHFNGCTFDVASACEYAVKCYSGKDFYFDGCTFKGNNKANIQLYIQDSSDTVHYVQVKDCKFYRGTDKSRTAVYYYDQAATEGGIWEIHLDGNNENLGEIAVNSDSGSWLWGSMKHNTSSSKTKVYEGETLVWANGVKQ